MQVKGNEGGERSYVRGKGEREKGGRKRRKTAQVERAQTSANQG
jgi:hypothetical protein